MPVFKVALQENDRQRLDRIISLLEKLIDHKEVVLKISFEDKEKV